MINYELFGRVLVHPIQEAIVTELEKLGDGAVMSPVEIAREIGHDVGHVSYHVRMLAGGNPKRPSRFAPTPLLELVRTRPVRGAVEHFYRLTEAATVREMALA